MRNYNKKVAKGPQKILSDTNSCRQRTRTYLFERSPHGVTSVRPLVKTFIAEKLEHTSAIQHMKFPNSAFITVHTASLIFDY